nr:zinc finger, CCHC-type [Tanacetum cinerariifolium]
MLNKYHHVQDLSSATGDDVAWWVDLGATMHVCKDRCWFKTYESQNDGSILHMGNELTSLVDGRGCVDLGFFTWEMRNKKYFVTFIDDALRFCYVYLLHIKDEALDKFKVFKTKVELQQGSLIKRFRTDREGEYMDTLYFQYVGIIHETTAPYTSQQNGNSERKNKTIMANLPPPDHVTDLPKDEPVNPKPAFIIPHHAPAQPEGYVSDDNMEDDKEEDPDVELEKELIEQVVPEQNNMDGFTLHMNPQPAENIDGWLIKDDDEEEEEDGVDRVDEVINAYEEVDPLNRLPPTSNEETEFAPPVAPIADVTARLIHLVRWGCNLNSIHRVVTRLDKQMFDRYKTEKRMSKRFKEDEFRMNDQKYNITALDVAVRENRSDHSKMMKFIEGLSRRFNKFKEQSHRAERLSRWKAWVRGRIPVQLQFQEEPPIYSVSTPRADDPYAMVRDAVMATREDDDDDVTTPRDP